MKLFVLAPLLFLTLPAMGSSIGPLGPTSSSDDASLGDIAWVNPTNANANDGIFATAVLTSGPGTTDSHYLAATNYGFGIPTGATISGILVEVERQKTGGVIQDKSIKLVKGGVIGGTEKSASAAYPTSEAFTSFGSSSDLWGQTWTYADINATNFGVAMQATVGSGTSTAQVDYVRITVFFNPVTNIGAPLNLFE